MNDYFRLIKENHDFRRLWLSQLISNFGDWFGLLAVYDIILRTKGSPLLLGLIIIVKMMSFAVFSPWAGAIADRFDRKKLMIWCDVLRTVAVLGFLWVDETNLWLLYALTAIQMMISAVFEPAKSAAVPNLVAPHDLVRANVISGTTWSIVFAVSMGMGGLATAYLGTSWVFVIDALSYLWSAFLIWKIVAPTQKSITTFSEKESNSGGILDGFRYLRRNPQVLRPVIVKGSTSIFLGGLVYALVLLADTNLAMGAVGVGVLYAARGIGTAIGPIVAKRWFSRSEQYVSAFGFFKILAGGFYMTAGWFSGIFPVMLSVLAAHAASASSWVLSTVLVQERAEDAFRGRVFSVEWMFFTVSQSVSTLVASLLIEANWLSVTELMTVFGAGLILLGLFWSIFWAKIEPNVWWRREIPMHHLQSQ
jgi:MFS family permease